MQTVIKVLVRGFFIMCLLSLNVYAYNIVKHGDYFRGGLTHIIDVHAYGGYLYCSDYGRMTVFKMTDPTTLTLTSTRSSAISWNITANDKVVVNSARYHGLYVYDRRTQPEIPLLLNQVTLPNVSFEGLEFVNDKLYAAAHDKGVYIFDVPADLDSAVSPLIQAGIYSNAGDAWAVAPVGNLLYIANGVAGLHIADISNPNQPQQVSVLATPGTAQDIKVRGNYVYVAMGHDGIGIYNISNPASPTFVSQFKTSGNASHLDVYNNKVYVADADDIEIIDVFNPAQPFLAGKKRTGERAMSLMVQNGYVYVADWGRVGVYEWKDIPGPDLETNVRHVEFPRTAFGDTSRFSIIITNHGKQDLQISTSQISQFGTTTPEYFTPQSSFSVSAGGSSEFLVYYVPQSALSAAAGYLSLISNDSDEPDVSIGLVGNRAKPMVGDPAPEINLPYYKKTTSFVLSEKYPSHVLLTFFAPW